MTNRFAGCVRRRDLADTERQKTFAHERPQPHPIERPDSSLGDKMRRIPRRDERKNAGAPTAVRRSRAGQRGCFAVSGTSERRANPLAGASALQARRGQRRTRNLLATRYPRSRERAEKFVKNIEEHERERNTKMFAAKRRALPEIRNSRFFVIFGIKSVELRSESIRRANFGQKSEI